MGGNGPYVGGGRSGGGKKPPPPPPPPKNNPGGGGGGGRNIPDGFGLLLLRKNGAINAAVNRG